MKSNIRVKKLKTFSAIKYTSEHNDRSVEVVNAKPGVKNIYQGNMDNVEGVKDIFARLDITPRKDQVLALEYVITASPEFFESGDRDKLKEWYKANVKFLKEKHPQGLVSVAMHMDETSPHIHAVVVPVIHRTKTYKNKPPREYYALSAKEFTGGKKVLADLQTEYNNAVKHLGLKRGLRYSKAKHTAVNQLYRRIDDTIKKANENANNLEKEKEQFNEMPVFGKSQFFKKMLNFVDKLIKSNRDLMIITKIMEDKLQTLQGKQDYLERAYTKLTDLFENDWRNLDPELINKIKTIKSQYDNEKENEKKAMYSSENAVIPKNLMNEQDLKAVGHEKSVKKQRVVDNSGDLSL